MMRLRLLLFVLLLPAIAFAQSGPSGGSVTSTGSIAANDCVKFVSATVITSNGAACGSGSGTVSSFSAGTLSPLFTTSVATATSTPALSFSLSNAGAYTFFGNNSGSTAAPAFATLVSSAPTNGNCVQWSVVAGAIKFADTGGACGGTPGGGIIGYSAASLTLTAATYFFPIVGGGTPSATETNVDTEAPSAATIANFYASFSQALGAGNSAVFTYRNNAADTSMTCTISGASATTCNDSTHSFVVAKGDLITIKVVTTGTIVVTPTLVMTAQFGTTGSNGTVNTGTTGQVGYYAAGGTAISGVGPGTTTTVLHGNASGAPSFGAIVNGDITNSTIDLTAKVTGILPVANGGTNNAFFTVSGPASSAKTYTFPNANATMTITVASGTSAMGTSAISSATCATTVTTAATGTLTTDVVQANFNSSPTAVTGYIPATAGMLAIIAFPTADNVNFQVCNNTTSSITPGAITLNWRVTR